MHKGETCDEYQLRVEEEKKWKEEASAVTMNKIARRCPSCLIPIEKNRGCDHMTCKVAL